MTLRRRRLLLLSSLVAIFLWGACTAKKERPSNILSHSEMVKAITEVYLAEQKVNRLGLQTDSAKKILNRIKSGLFKEKHVSDSAFDESFNYYIDRPAELEEIYVALVDSLTLKEQLLNATPP